MKMALCLSLMILLLDAHHSQVAYNKILSLEMTNSIAFEAAPTFITKDQECRYFFLTSDGKLRVFEVTKTQLELKTEILPNYQMTDGRWFSSLEFVKFSDMEQMLLAGRNGLWRLLSSGSENSMTYSVSEQLTENRGEKVYSNLLLEQDSKYVYSFYAEDCEPEATIFKLEWDRLSQGYSMTGSVSQNLLNHIAHYQTNRLLVVSSNDSSFHFLTKNNLASVKITAQTELQIVLFQTIDSSEDEMDVLSASKNAIVRFKFCDGGEVQSLLKLNFEALSGIGFQQMVTTSATLGLAFLRSPNEIFVVQLTSQSLVLECSIKKEVNFFQTSVLSNKFELHNDQLHLPLAKQNLVAVLNCQPDPEQTCIGASGFFSRSDFSCHEQIPQGFGSENGSNIIRLCAVAECSDCAKDYLLCSHCFNKLKLVRNSCESICSRPLDGLTQRNLEDLQHCKEFIFVDVKSHTTTFDRKNSKLQYIQIEFADDLELLQANTRIWTHSKSSECFDCLTVDRIERKQGTNFFNINVGVLKPLHRATLYLAVYLIPKVVIRASNSDKKNRLLNTPSPSLLVFTVSDFYVETDSKTQELSSITNIYSLLVKIIHMGVLKTFLVGFAFSSSFRLHVHLSYFMLLKVMRGQYLGLSNWIIDAVAGGSYFGVFPTSTFQEPSIERCHLPASLRLTNLSCSLIENYGVNLLTLVGLLILNSIVSFLRRKKVDHVRFYWGKKFDMINYGYRFFCLMVNGSLYEILVVSLINIFYFYRSTLMILGLITALIFLTFYVAITFELYKKTRLVATKTSDSTSTVAYEMSRNEDPKISFLRHLKMFAQSLLCISLMKTALYQNLSVIFVELSYLLTVLIAGKKHQKTSNSLEAASSSLNIAYLTINSISLLGLEAIPSQRLGEAAFSILACHSIFVLVDTVIDCYTTLTSGKKTKVYFKDGSQGKSLPNTKRRTLKSALKKSTFANSHFVRKVKPNTDQL